VKKENTILRQLRKKVVIDGLVVTEIYFDLKHINHGWDSIKRDYKEGPARQNLTEDDVVAFFEQLATLIQIPFSQRSTLRSVEKRFIFYVYENDKKFKMVVDIMKNEATVVVTIH